MGFSSLLEIYKRANPKVQHVFVVPLIRFEFKETDYLFLLYQSLLVKNTSIQIHSTSAIGHIKFVLVQCFRKKAILHYHWLEFQDPKSLIGMPYKLFMIWLFELFGGKVVWTVHNLEPHDQKYLSLHRRIHQWMAKKATFLLVHSSYAKAKVHSHYLVEESKVLVFKHPVFPSTPIEKITAIQIMQQSILQKPLLVGSPIFLMFGAISSYKRILEVVEIMKGIDADFNLIIAGYVKKGQTMLHEALTSENELHQWLHYVPGFLPESLYPSLLNAADVCIYNYDRILTSGGIEMAKSYNKRIIAPALEALSMHSETPGIQFFHSEQDLKQQLEMFISEYPNG